MMMVVMMMMAIYLSQLFSQSFPDAAIWLCDRTAWIFVNFRGDIV